MTIMIGAIIGTIAGFVITSVGYIRFITRQEA